MPLTGKGTRIHVAAAGTFNGAVAISNAAQTVTSGTTLEPLLLATTIKDSGSYITSAGVFTVPTGLGGLYAVSAFAQAQPAASNAASGMVQFAIDVSSWNYFVTVRLMWQEANNLAGSFWYAYPQAVGVLAAADTVKLYASNTLAASGGAGINVVLLGGVPYQGMQLAIYKLG